MIVKKVVNTLKYQKNMWHLNYLYKNKYSNIKNDALISKAAQYNIYCQLKKKYAPKANVNNQKSPECESKKIWVCWFQGKEKAPDLIKTCINIMENNFKNYEVIILTWDNYKKYTDIPEYVMDRFKRKELSIVHLSDIIRADVLTRHGGLWLDSTVLCSCTDIPKYMEHKPLFVYKEIDFVDAKYKSTIASSWLIYSGKNNNILKATLDMLYEYWKTENYLIDYFLFHIFFKIATELYPEEWDAVPNFNNINPHMLQFELGKKYNKKRWVELMKMSDFHKLNRHIVFDENTFTNYNYILNGLKEK